MEEHRSDSTTAVFFSPMWPSKYTLFKKKLNKKRKKIILGSTQKKFNPHSIARFHTNVTPLKWRMCFSSDCTKYLLCCAVIPFKSVGGWLRTVILKRPWQVLTTHHWALWSPKGTNSIVTVSAYLNFPLCRCQMHGLVACSFSRYRPVVRNQALCTQLTD